MPWHSGIICQKHRVERIMAKQNKMREEATHLMETIDASRDNDVALYRSQSLRRRNYDLILDMDLQTED